MSRDEFDEGFWLTAFIGEREPILRLAHSLHRASVLELGFSVYMVPLTREIREAVTASGSTLDPECDYDRKWAAAWSFASISFSSADRCAKFAGTGRIALIEVHGYKDYGAENGIGWQDGQIWLGPRGAAIDGIGDLLRVSPHQRDVFRRRVLRIATHLEHFVSAAAAGNQPFRRGTS